MKSNPVESPAKAWRVALLALGVLLLTILVLYRETAVAMVEIWARSETFTHAFLVPPISLWLIWRLRREIAQIAPEPNIWALLALSATGFFWLLGESAAVGVVSQFSLATMLVLAVTTVLGLSISRRMVFPLAFLYFAVPFGEFALPQLMEWTANFTILGLRLSGIPVYREGLQFVIPSGSWSVVEACSGVRYLIASLTVGTLFAYLTYHSLRRRLVFVGVAFVVPVVANWLRAYLIVMLGHFSGNKLATGVDHSIYGWLFFGIVIMAMFWIGSRWRENAPLAVNERSNCSPTTGPGSIFSPLVVALLAVAILPVWPLAQWQIERSVPAQISEIALLEPVAGWSLSPEPFANWVPSYENPSAVVQTTFNTEGKVAGLFMAYYRNQDYSRKMVSSGNVLVHSKDPLWARVASGSRQIEIAGQSVSLRTSELRSVDSSRLVVWQLYWINGHLTASDHKAKALTALFRVFGQGDDSAVIVVYAPKEQPGGEAALESFVKAAGPKILSALNRTRDQR